MTYILLYLLAVNLLLFAVMGIDKYKAKHQLWRIPERTLFVLAAIGGSLGGILGMRLFHHKTLHPQFRYGFPAILILQLILAGFLVYHFFF
ncbi:MAG: DUF1294 domain-containing protein [Oscillospiraceae bacterium]|nr:DUF1294 domain-containing protein [Oscillospiraceae bacterium]